MCKKTLFDGLTNLIKKSTSLKNETFDLAKRQKKNLTRNSPSRQTVEPVQSQCQTGPRYSPDLISSN